MKLNESDGTINIKVNLDTSELDEVYVKCERLVSALSTAERLLKELGVKKEISLTVDFEG